MVKLAAFLPLPDRKKDEEPGGSSMRPLGSHITDHRNFGIENRLHDLLHGDSQAPRSRKPNQEEFSLAALCFFDGRLRQRHARLARERERHRWIPTPEREAAGALERTSPSADER